MTLNVLFPQRFADGFVNNLIQVFERCFKAGWIVNTIRRGEHVEPGNTEQVFTRVVWIAGQMLFDERFDLSPIRKLARGFTRSCQQNAIVAERTAQEQNVGMSIGHGLIIARGGI